MGVATVLVLPDPPRVRRYCPGIPGSRREERELEKGSHMTAKAARELLKGLLRHPFTSTHAKLSGG